MEKTKRPRIDTSAQTGAFASAGLQQCVNMVINRLHRCEPKQRPQSVPKLTSFAKGCVREGAKLFAFSPADVADEVLQKLPLRSPVAEEVREILAIAQAPQDYRGDVSLKHWQQRGPLHGWSAIPKRGVLSAKGAALWICQSAYVRVHCPAESVVTALLATHCCCEADEDGCLRYLQEAVVKNPDPPASRWAERWKLPFESAYLKDTTAASRRTPDNALSLVLRVPHRDWEKLTNELALPEPESRVFGEIMAPPTIPLFGAFHPLETFNLARVKRKLQELVQPVPLELAIDDVTVKATVVDGDQNIAAQLSDNTAKRLKALQTQVGMAFAPIGGEKQFLSDLNKAFKQEKVRMRGSHRGVRPLRGSLGSSIPKSLPLGVFRVAANHGGFGRGSRRSKRRRSELKQLHKVTEDGCKPLKRMLRFQGSFKIPLLQLSLMQTSSRGRGCREVKSWPLAEPGH
mmetsp:Transcript_61286/g.145927  ORF Transcript_61286/g.145927 Transcript_61286/m.145927 type:complete len:459 (-) Transcript_61286:46-1422(-)